MLTVSFGLVFLLGRYSVARTQQQPVLTVNGKVATRHELDQTMALYRDKALVELCTEMLIADKAQRRQIVPENTRLSGTPVDPELRGALLARHRTEVLTRELLRAEVTESEAREFYEAFEPELTRHTLSYVLLSEAVNPAALQHDLQSGAPLEQLRKWHGRKDPDQPNLPAAPNGEELHRLFGSRAEQVATLPLGRLTGPLPSRAGMLLVRVEQRRSSFSDLRPDIDNYLIEAKKNAYLFALGTSASISSPLQWASVERIPTRIADEAVAVLPRPAEDKAMPAAGALAAPAAAVGPAPASLAKPKATGVAPVGSLPAPAPGRSPAKTLPAFRPRTKPAPSAP